MRNGALHMWAVVPSPEQRSHFPKTPSPRTPSKNGDVWVCEFTVTDNITPPVAETAQPLLIAALKTARCSDCPAKTHDNDPSLVWIDGVYYVKPDLDTHTPFCDMTHDGGGWSLSMRHSTSTETVLMASFATMTTFSWETEAT